MAEIEYEINSLEGVQKKTIKTLIDKGFTTYLSLAVTPINEVATITGFSEDLAEKVTGFAIKQISKFRTAEEYSEERKQHIEKLTTGSQEFNNILNGGYETGAITELVGEYGSGKSQLCYTATVMVQQPKEEGGLEGAAVVIDTEGTYIPERAEEIAISRGYNVSETMKNIHYIKAYNTRHLTDIIRELADVLEETKARLIVVDSLAAHFRSEYEGRQDLAPRQQRLGGILGNLLRYAEAFNAVVLVTNQMQGNPSGYGGDKMALGHVMAHAATHRIKLRKGRLGTRIAKTEDSPNLPVCEAVFLITEAGAVDVGSGKKKKSGEIDDSEDN